MMWYAPTTCRSDGHVSFSLSDKQPFSNEIQHIVLFAVADGGELNRLKRDYAILQEELAQCKADKEFVWSLWKRLQVANPDISQAIGITLQQ